MKKRIKFIIIVFCLLPCMMGLLPLLATASASAQTHTKIELSPEEQAFVLQTQEISPLDIGIIPHTFPLSDCPPNTKEFVGINVDMLAMISEVSGLRFAYNRIPVEEKTPYQAMQDGTYDLVAGTIKLDNFLQDPRVLLSDRLSDGSAICIAKRSTTPSTTSGKISVLNGYQAGSEYAKEKFPNHEIITYPDNREVLSAVREDKADLAIISRYVGLYELQNPMNDYLIDLPMYTMEKDSCIMGLNTPLNQTVISIIDKSLVAIGEDGYNYAQMNFSLTNPYKPTFVELLYKYRYILFGTGVVFVIFCILIARLRYTQKEHKRLSLDTLTGALSEAGFELAVTKILPKSSKPLFVTDFDICLFSSYNELNGKAEGDALLKNIVKIVKSYLCEQDAICRFYADHFIILTCKDNLDELIADIHVASERFNAVAKSRIMTKFGVYPVTDTTVPISKMLDFAAMAKRSIKDNASTIVTVFDENLLERYVNEAKMISAFQDAITDKAFVAYYQPKFNAAKKTVSGAEALVRWVSKDGTLIPPIQFIGLFERSGQIQQLDLYMLEQTCIFLQGLASKGISMLPIAVNFSRVHLYNNAFIDEVNAIVERYKIPKCFIEIEFTETTMLNNTDLTKAVLGNLQDQGFSIAMDDFGSAYSSLNTLSTIPLDVLKLDGGFLAVNLSHEKVKSNIIIRSIIALAHDLSLKVVAEGVETEGQYLFLKDLGCDYIQGYYFSKPLDEARFLEILTL